MKVKKTVDEELAKAIKDYQDALAEHRNSFRMLAECDPDMVEVVCFQISGAEKRVEMELQRLKRLSEKRGN